MCFYCSRLSKGFSNQFTMQQCDCITVYTQCLQVFLNAFDAPTHRTMLHAGKVAFNVIYVYMVIQSITH